MLRVARFCSNIDINIMLIDDEMSRCNFNQLVAVIDVDNIILYGTGLLSSFRHNCLELLQQKILVLIGRM